MNLITLQLDSASVASAATEGVAEPAEAGGIAALGINVSALGFQILNFAILLWLLQRFAYRPIIKVLEERRQRITESLATAKDLETQRARLAAEQHTILGTARQQARDIVTTAEHTAATLQAAADERNRATSERVIAEAHSRITNDVKQARTALRREVAGLVVRATERLLDEKLDLKKDAALIERALATQSEASEL